MGAAEMTTPQNKIEIFGPKDDGSYWIEFPATGWTVASRLDPGERCHTAQVFSGADSLGFSRARCFVTSSPRNVEVLAGVCR